MALRVSRETHTVLQGRETIYRRLPASLQRSLPPFPLKSARRVERQLRLAYEKNQPEANILLSSPRYFVGFIGVF
ncbi:MAG: hypothetical protein Ct9H300mP8_11300 [Gammaproteobacteria bacterium]|nr:MAG: hypothetical protein Ct9H300mP8_11300 [Gammaproteobacteria bacterium]